MQCTVKHTFDFDKFYFDINEHDSEISNISNNIILQIYLILKNPSSKTKAVITEWEKLLDYLYGDLNSKSINRKINILNFSKIYKTDIKNKKDFLLLFFAIQTYFSLIIKYILKIHLTNNEYTVKDFILGNFAKEWNIENYCSADFYCWPIFEINNGFTDIINNLNQNLAIYIKPISISTKHYKNNDDYIKQLYEVLIPKQLRHALGEYYTPNWLAELTLDNSLSISECSILKAKIIDPTCGSGTFIIKAINKKRKYTNNLDNIISTVIGFDINPLAILTAKTNYILSIMDIIEDKVKGKIKIPIYNTDVLKFGTFENSGEIICKTTFEDNPIQAINYFINQDQIMAQKYKNFDLIIGNPPWVNWEYLPEQYKKQTQHLWKEYKLFSAKGIHLSFSKEDISTLITYIVIDKLLKDKGFIGFVLKQSIFKSAQNGVNFRNFKIKDSYNIKVIKVDDFSAINVFNNTTNATSVFYAQKNCSTIYPVPYYLWKKRNGTNKNSFNPYSSLGNVIPEIDVEIQSAMPSVEKQYNSLWITSPIEKLKAMKKYLGQNNYKARTGVFTGGANGVYWINILKNKDTNVINITNIVERAKRTVKKVHSDIEPTYIYPMLKGRNINRWNITYDSYIICPHSITTKMWPIPQYILKKQAPLTYKYLYYFKKDLDSRKGFAGWEKNIQNQEFHSILRIGEYTFSKYKVVWRYIASEFICAVVSSVQDKYLGEKNILPNEKVMYVSFNNEDEAYFLCGILSSKQICECVKSYMNPTSISAHILDKLNIPDYDKNNKLHYEIAKICKLGHNEYKPDYIDKINLLVEELYNNKITT